MRTHIDIWNNVEFGRAQVMTFRLFVLAIAAIKGREFVVFRQAEPQ